MAEPGCRQVSCRAGHREERGDRGWGRRSFRGRGVRNSSLPTLERYHTWVLFTGQEEVGRPTAPEQNTASQTPAPCADFWRLEVQREKLRSAGHWGEESRSGVVGVAGGGNDKSPLPAAGVFGAPGERGRERGEVTAGVGGGAQSTQLVPSSPTLLIAPKPCTRTPESQDFNYFPRPADSSLIPFRSQEILHPESHLLSSLKGISPSAPSLPTPGQSPISAPPHLVAAKWNVSGRSLEELGLRREQAVPSPPHLQLAWVEVTREGHSPIEEGDKG